MARSTGYKMNRNLYRFLKEETDHTGPGPLSDMGVWTRSGLTTAIATIRAICAKYQHPDDIRADIDEIILEEEHAQQVPAQEEQDEQDQEAGNNLTDQ